MNKFDHSYIAMAGVWAQNSYCKRRQVGALLVKDRMIISDGYNGTPSGFENICEDENGVTKPYVLHAEANAITKVEKLIKNVLFFNLALKFILIFILRTPLVIVITILHICV